MKLENVVLMGFVDSALKYLEKQVKEDRSDKIEDFDLSSLRRIQDDLNSRLAESMQDFSAPVATLKETGSRAFEKFIEERKKPSLIEEFDEIFSSVSDDIENETDSLLEPYQNDVDEEYMKLIADASARAREQEIDFDVDSLFDEVMKEDKQGEEIDDLFRQIVDHEEEMQTIVPKEDNVKADVYVSSLVDELKKQLQKEEEAKKAEVNERMSIYKKINEIYPYLSAGFVRAVYDMKNSIAIEYPLHENVIILHRQVFHDLEELRQFVEIVLGHDYNVNVDEEKMIVDVFKEHYNTDGKIITNIFEIANQAKLLNGEYDGYRVIVKEEE